MALMRLCAIRAPPSPNAIAQQQQLWSFFRNISIAHFVCAMQNVSISGLERHDGARVTALDILIKRELVLKGRAKRQKKVSVRWRTRLRCWGIDGVQLRFRLHPYHWPCASLPCWEDRRSRCNSRQWRWRGGRRGRSRRRRCA